MSRSVAIVLAGGDASDQVALRGGVPGKALLPVAGRPLAAYVLDALERSGRVSRVVYVGPIEQELSSYDVVGLPGGRRFEDSLALGMGAALAMGAESLLVATADLPWLTPAAVARFADAASALDVDVVYPVVSEADMNAAFPEQRRTYVRLREGRFTGGNLALLSRAGALALLPVISRAFAARKNPLALAALVGPGVVAGLLTGTATLGGLEARVSRLLGVPGRALPVADAGIAADVDRLDHLPGVLDPAQPGWEGA